MQSLKFYAGFILVFADAMAKMGLGIAQEAICLASVAGWAKPVQQQPAPEFAIFEITDSMDDFCWHFLAGLPEVIK